ncbi:hypothetical protein N9444_04805, partial [Gammaproteobacteria bacterium]|nr:hypothetical protein [Gammaproteobacteria bacterium]
RRQWLHQRANRGFHWRRGQWRKRNPRSLGDDRREHNGNQSWQWLHQRANRDFHWRRGQWR